MPEPDDEIRDLFREGHSADRDTAPSFGATWAAASAKGRPRRGRWLAGGLALAAAAALSFVLLPSDAQPPRSAADQLAATLPKADVPSKDESDELAPISDDAFADWEPDSYDAPTDFLMESDGVLAGGMPSSEWDEPMLNFEETPETTEL